MPLIRPRIKTTVHKLLIELNKFNNSNSSSNSNSNLINSYSSSSHKVKNSSIYSSNSHNRSSLLPNRNL